MYDQKFLWKVGALKKAMLSNGSPTYSEEEIAQFMGYSTVTEFREKLMTERAKRRKDMVDAAKELKKVGMSIAQISCGLKESPYSVKLLLNDGTDDERSEPVRVEVPGYGTVLAYRPELE